MPSYVNTKFLAMPTANRNTEVSRVVLGDSQQKHILQVIVARTRRYLNNLLAGNLDWIFHFYLFIFLNFQLYLLIFLAQKRLEHAATELVNGSCARRFNHEPLSVSVSFFNHSSSSFLDTCAYSQDSFFSFTIGIFPFFTFRHSQSSFKRIQCHPEQAYWLQKWLLSNEKDSNTILPLNIWRLEVKR